MAGMVPVIDEWIRGNEMSPQSIRANRERLGISQREAARLTGFSQKHWSEVESGTCGASREFIAAVESKIIGLCPVTQEEHDLLSRMIISILPRLDVLELKSVLAIIRELV